jgi:putative sugar O-methyltransferase
LPVGLESKISKFENEYKKFIGSYKEFNESNLQYIDQKHQTVLNAIEKDNAYEKINLQNLRNWALQDDMGTPLTLKYVMNSQKWIIGLATYVYKKLFDRNYQKQLRANIDVDLDLIKLTDSLEILKENPVDKTPGATSWIVINKLCFNTRWLRYVYLAKQIIKRNMINDGDIWVDIGSYYGGLQSIVFKYNPNGIYVLVDFKHQLLRSYIFLNSQYPDAKHVYGDEIKIDDFKQGTFIYMSLENISILDKLQIKLVSNFFSFGEMNRNFYLKYTKSVFFQRAKYLYLVNRFISSPFFERTYDSDLNIFDYQYKNFSIEYFDIFPMHHYAQVKRDVVGSMRTLNTSSGYFELYYKNKMME